MPYSWSGSDSMRDRQRPSAWSVTRCRTLHGWRGSARRGEDGSRKIRRRVNVAPNAWAEGRYLRAFYESNQPLGTSGKFQTCPLRGPTVGHLVLKARAMDDRAQLDNCIFALCQRREELVTQISELENLRDRVAKAERRIVGAARRSRTRKLRRRFMSAGRVNLASPGQAPLEEDAY
jgi:hypothetical protein